LSFKPPGFFTSTKYEKLRVAAADAEEDLSDKCDDVRHVAKKDDEDGDLGADGSNDDEEEDEDEEEEEEDAKAKFQVKSRVGGFFGLLQDDDGDQDDDSESDNE
jgi:hypothetical protein